MEFKFRTLKADEIELRVGQIKKDGCSLLLYQDSRCGMNLLDEVVGSMNWCREHNFKDGKLYCKVGIWDDKKNQFVYKEDVGVESNTEAEKGQSSDSFKRACVNWGIGRELYSAPFTWIKLNDGETYEKNGKAQLSPSVKFSVKTIEYDSNRNISKLVIVDSKGNERFTFGVKKQTSEPKKQVQESAIDIMVPTPEEIAGLIKPETLTKEEMIFASKDEVLTKMMQQACQGKKFKDLPHETKKDITNMIRKNMEIRGLSI